MITPLYFKETHSPVGKLKLVASNEGLVAILWEKERDGRVPLETMELSSQHAILVETEKQLSDYFLRKRRSFNLPLKPLGTDFQLKVWKALCEIPYGKTKSYGELAREIASPKASRAVGAANGRNPISIVIPCHRVVTSNGKLGGFAGGLKTKEILLKLEMEL